MITYQSLPRKNEGDHVRIQSKIYHLSTNRMMELMDSYLVNVSVKERDILFDYMKDKIENKEDYQ